MATVHLRIGDLVWGKLGRYPPWPGKVVSPPKDLKKPRGKKCHFVKFFGTEDHAWIKVEHLKPYHPHKEEMIKLNKGKRVQQAVNAVEDFLKKAKGKEQVRGCPTTQHPVMELYLACLDSLCFSIKKQHVPCRKHFGRRGCVKIKDF